MRRASVYLRKTFVGELREVSPNKYVFRYDDLYFFDPVKQDISLTLTKKQQEYKSQYLFPFFANMLSEGESRSAQAKLLQIDENDDFGILLATTQYDVSGGIILKPLL